MNDNYRIKVSKLYKELGFSNGKIPPKLGKIYVNYNLPTVNGGNFFTTLLIIPSVKTARKSSKHRIFVNCPKCEKIVPAGRLAQHIGTGNCK